MKHAKYWVNQLEASECGLACIATVLKIFGSNIDLHHLRARLGSNSSGLTLKRLMGMCRSVGLRSRPVRCDLNELNMLRLPAILHWDFNHYVVLVATNRGRAEIVDPAIGARSILLADVSRHFTGAALEVEPDETFTQEVKAERLKLRSLFIVTREIKPALIAAVVLTFIGQVLTLAGPVYMQLAVDHSATSGDFSFLGTLAVGFCLLALFSALSDALRGIALNQLTIIFSWDATVRFFNKMMTLPFIWFGKRRLSDVLARFDSLDVIRSVFTQVLISSALDALFLVLVLTLMVLISLPLAGLAVAAFVLVLGMRLATQWYAVQLGAESFSASIVERSRRIDAFRAIQAIKDHLNNAS